MAALLMDRHRICRQADRRLLLCRQATEEETPGENDAEYRAIERYEADGYNPLKP